MPRCQCHAVIPQLLCPSEAAWCCWNSNPVVSQHLDCFPSGLVVCAWYERPNLVPAPTLEAVASSGLCLHRGSQSGLRCRSPPRRDPVGPAVPSWDHTGGQRPPRGPAACPGATEQLAGSLLQGSTPCRAIHSPQHHSASSLLIPLTHNPLQL